MREWMAEARRKKGLSCKQAAEALGISEPYYSMIESGNRKKKFDLPFALAVCKLLDIPMEVLIQKEM